MQQVPGQVRLEKSAQDAEPLPGSPAHTAVPKKPKEYQTAAPSLLTSGGEPVGGGWHLPPNSTRTQA